MELGFDKEIDAMLRNARRDGPAPAVDAASAHHLDADAIAALAENALPEKARGLYVRHAAECERCRKILSNILIMNAGQETAAAAASPSVITIAERGLPWYRRMLLFPNLAYVMGSLVLIFGGFLAFSVMRNSQNGESTIAVHVDDTLRTRGGPNFQTQTEFPDTGSAANTSANAMMPAEDSAANTNPAITPLRTPGLRDSGPRAGDNNFTIDGMSAGETALPPPPATATGRPAPKAAGERDAQQPKDKAEEKIGGVELTDQAKNDAVLKQQSYSNMPTQSGPMRNNENQYNRQLENMDRRAAAAKRSDEDGGTRKRVISGKTFERKQGVWYDATYQGRPTINVRRESDEFKRLDAGLRSIANTLGGTVVIVWGAKAYRIQ